MSVSVWQDHKWFLNSPDQQFNIVIIGGGIAGLSTAYWLLKEKQNLKICIVEKSEIGDGATGRNAGFITCGSVEHFNRLVIKHGKGTAKKIWKFSEENLNLLKSEVINGHESSLDFEQTGSFSLASTEQELKELRESCDIMKSLDIDVEPLSEQEIKKRLGANEFEGGIKYINDASINPMKLLIHLKALILKDPNCTLLENHEVYKIDSHGEQKLIKTKKGHIKTDIVIYATNGYSAQLDPYFVNKILPTRGQILVTAPVKRFMEGPCYANFVLDYFRQLPSGELIIGGFRQLQKDVEIGYSDQVSDIIQDALEAFLRKHIPNLEKTPITHRWSGIMGFSVDGQPLIGSLPTDSQTYFVGGFTAHGLGLAFHSAKCLVDLIFDREIPDFISAKRF